MSDVPTRVILLTVEVVGEVVVGVVGGAVVGVVVG